MSASMIRGGARLISPMVIQHQSQRGLQNMAKSVVATLRGPATERALKAALVELRPPTPAELPQAFRDGIRIFTKGNWRNITVREAWLNALVTTEVICWFFVGECLGKGTFIGYQV